MTDAPATHPALAGSRLTPRQLLVAELVADGESRRGIAQALGCSPHTVRRHVENIAMRLDGPGKVRARICRYIRGRRDAALARHHHDTPMAWEPSA